MKRDEPLYPIGVVSRLCGCHPQTLRMYERLGLIKPQRVGAKNRMYSEADLERLRRIQRLTQDMGVNLAGVEVILRLLDEIAEMQNDFDEHLTRLQHEMERRIAELTKDSRVPVPAERVTITRFRRKVDV